MISDVMGLCQNCNQSHKLSICGSVLEGQKLKITVYNAICNSCIEKVDYIFKNNLFFKEGKVPIIKNGKRKIVLVDAATNTDHIQNYEYKIHQENSHNSTLEKNIRASSNEQSIQTGSCINPQKSHIPDEGKSQRCLYCEFCKKKFTHTGDLNKHRRKHTGERPYDCLICNRKFSHASNLLRHQRLHSGEKPFSCPLKCGRTFSRKDKLSNHISKHHPNT